MKKVITFILSVAIFFSISNLYVYAMRNPKTTSEQYVVEDITYDEYVKLKAEFLNISSDKMKNEMLTTGKTNSNNTVYRKYTKTFSYPSNKDYKTDLVCLFTLTGQDNYFDITEVIVGSNKSTNSKYDKWSQTAMQTRTFCGSNVTVYATGKFEIDSWISDPIDMVADVTVDELKYFANIKNV